jgi:hypothetical protein
MPRQLPWASKGAGSRAQVKPTTSRQVAKPRVAPAIDDDFFDDTVLGSSSKGKAKAQESDDDLPQLPEDPSTPRTKTRTKDVLRSKRVQSSSPPPMSDDLEQPEVETMRSGASKFDLRDDEWMMVEDEFLETAKIFTRHLHIAEYEKMKETIEAKKQAEVARPVVPNAKLSINGAMKEKAKIQEQKQKKAIRDVFASQKDEDDEDDEADHTTTTRTSFNRATSSFSVPRRILPTTLKRPPHPLAAQVGDSDDLDAPRLSSRSASRLTATPTPTPAPTRNPAERLKSTSSQAPNTGDSGVAFTKPSLPAAGSKSRSRISRATPFDMLDDWVPNKTQSVSQSSSLGQHDGRTPEPLKPSPRPVSPIKRSAASSASITKSASRSFDSLDEMRSSKPQKTNGISKDTADRLAKQRADPEKDDKAKKRKVASVDDIPTFLF